MLKIKKAFSDYLEIVFSSGLNLNFINRFSLSAENENKS